jgi:putative ABC transport system permease protein
VELSESKVLRRELRQVERPLTHEPVFWGSNGRTNVLGGLWQDLRYGARMLRQHPGFTLVAMFSLALAIGANSVIFSLVNAVIFRPLPYPEPARLVKIYEFFVGDAFPGHYGASSRNYLEWQRQAQSFEEMAVTRRFSGIMTGRGEPETLEGLSVSSSFFSMVGVQPALGRAFRPDEEQAGANVVIIGHQLWQRHFNHDPDIIGQTVTLTGSDYTIVGVMPPGFRYPLQENDILAPLDLSKPDSAKSFGVIARLKSGCSIKQAHTEIETLSRQLEVQYPQYNRGFNAGVVSLHEELVGKTRWPMLILLGAVGFVLLIACANVANLLLARHAARQKEIAVRLALGASRWRLMQQLLTESVLLALLGGGGGLLLAFTSLDALLAISPVDLPRLATVKVDPAVILFTFALSTLTGVVFGVIPALQASKLDLNQTLKESSRSATESRRRYRLRGVLVVAEVALSLVLLIGAGLLIKSFSRLTRVDAGLNTRNVLTAGLSLPKYKYPDVSRQRTFYQQALERIRHVPGVEHAAVTYFLPFSTYGTDWFTIEGRPDLTGDNAPQAKFGFISEDYFRTMGIAMMKGRDFNERDTPDAPPVVIINPAAARQFWPNEDPIGKRITSQRKVREIVGVSGEVKQAGLDKPSDPEIFLAYQQAPYLFLQKLAVRTTDDPMKMVAAIRHEVQAIDQDLPLTGIKTMDQYLSESIANPRFQSRVLSLFAAIALLLAAVGLYGVMSYAVAQRTHEIGVRVALGARSSDVLKLVVGKGLRLTLIGIAIGLVAAVALTRLLASLLFGVSTTDPATFVIIALLLISVALLACYLPARRATKVDPMVALRYE